MLRTLARVTADFRAAIEAAGPDLWTAPHLGGSVPDDASFLDVVPLGRGNDFILLTCQRTTGRVRPRAKATT